MPKVSMQILVWARETAGLTLEEAAAKLGIRAARGKSPVERLSDLESGTAIPTRAMLAKMANVYRRPLLTFYLLTPPSKEDRGEDFRTLPPDYSESDDALLDVLVRDVVARQSMVSALLEAEDEAEALGFVGSAEVADGTDAVLASIRDTLNLDLADFYEGRSPADAFLLLRSAVEQTGVFVLLIGDLGSYHTAIDPAVFRGFAIADTIAPFIVINDRDSRSAWSFTLLHELAHVWLGQTGVSGAFSDMAVERFCNDVASEFLLPVHEINALNVNVGTPFGIAVDEIGAFAASRNLSGSMVAYKLFRLGRIELDQWQRLNATFRELWIESRSTRRETARERGGGPSYYTVRRHRIGDALLGLMSSMLDGGAISTSKAGKVLGVRAKNVGPLLDVTRST